MAIDLIFIGTIVGITNNMEGSARQCMYRTVRWLYAFAGWLGAQFLYDLYYTVKYGYSRRPSEGKRLCTDIFMTLISYGFGLAWLIYGNARVWNLDYECRFAVNGAERVWRLFASIIIIFYVFFLIYLFLWLNYLCLCCAWMKKRRGGQVPKFCTYLPCSRACTTQGEVVQKDIYECGICD